MKILVLMPLSEEYTYFAHAIYNAMPATVREKTFMMPAFIDYQLETKLAENSLYATAGALLAAQKCYDQAVEEKQDLIILGNIDKKYKFDVIFNFQDDKEDMAYKDPRAEKFVEIVKDSEIEYLAHDLYKNEDSTMPLHNPIATADFLTAYLETDPKLDLIKEEYEARLKGVSNGNN